MGYDPAKIEIGNNSIRYIGIVRGIDETGHVMFAINLQGMPEAFGEFDKRRGSDENHYGIDVRSFGYSLKDQAPSQARQYRFSRTQEKDIRHLIDALIRRDQYARNNIFDSFPEFFNGHISYADDWLHFAP